MEIDEIDYKGFKITTSYNKDDKSFHAYSLCGSSGDKFDSKRKNFSMGHETPDKAIKDVETKIDKFIDNTPKDYNELAIRLTENLTWTGYEDCHLNESIVKVLVENFNKLNSR